MSSSSQSLPFHSSPQPRSPAQMPTATATTTMDIFPALQATNLGMAGQWSQEFGGAQCGRSSSRTTSKSSPTTIQFGFITATEPGQFKRRDTMRSVRSHVMMNHVEKKHRSPTGNTPSRVNKRARASSTATPPSHQPNPSTIANDTALEIYRRQPKKSTTSSLTASTPRSETTSSPEAFVRRPTRQKTVDSVITEVLDDDVEQVMVQPPTGGRYGMNPLFKAAYQNIGPVNFFSPYDPFYTLPRPSNAAIDVERMKWHCHHYFGTKAMAREWLPQAIKDRESFLSTLCISSTHEDAMVGVQSHVTVIVNTEVNHMIQERLQQRWTRIKDSTIMSVAHLLCSRLVSSNEQERMWHEDGLRKLIEERGGMHTLGVGGELAAVSTAMAFTSSILRESRPHPLFLSYAATLPIPSLPASAQTPESPLFCPRPRFFTLERSKHNSPALLALLYDMRTLTALCLGPRTAETQAQMQSVWVRTVAVQSPMLDLGPAPGERERKVKCRAEAVRLAALLYAAAIVQGVPLSEAVGRPWPSCPVPSSASPPFDPSSSFDQSPFDPSSSSSSHTNPSSSSPHTEAQPSPPSPSQVLPALLSALKRSGAEFSDCWADQTGVLYWITLVAGTAARTGSPSTSNTSNTSNTSSASNTANTSNTSNNISSQTNTSSQTTNGAGSGSSGTSESKSKTKEEQRRYLVALNVRCAIVLAFEHRIAVVKGLEGMVGVVGALAGGGSGA